MIESPESAYKRFASRYTINEDTQCWNWIGSCQVRGLPYGSFYYKPWGIRNSAHRFSYRYHNGPIGELHVLHKCDNPKCVNPNHLFLGTNLDNIQDKQQKGRTPHNVGADGEDHGLSWLTNKQVLMVDALLKQGQSQQHISDIIGCHRSLISRISAGELWDHITGRVYNPTKKRKNPTTTKEQKDHIIRLKLEGVLTRKQIAELVGVTPNVVYHTN